MVKKKGTKLDNTDTEKVIKEAPEEIIEDTPQQESTSEAVEETEVVKDKNKKNFHWRSLISTKKRKIITIIAGILVLVGILLLIPLTRYAILSPFIRKDITVTVVDSKTNKPVSNAIVVVGGVTSQSDKNGKSTLKSVPVGQYQLKVQKQYYRNYESPYTVPVFAAPSNTTNAITATGRQVTVNITNKITGDAVADVVVNAGNTKATTNDKGMAIIILPPTDQPVNAILTKDGYNSASVTLKVDESIANAYAVTPSGTINYLSKATGKIDVMESNLDGTNARVVVEGTGQESDYETSLLSSRDWAYSALSATRTDNTPRLYLFDANKNELSVMDEGNATYGLVGWSGHNFIYIVYRNTDNVWDDKRQALKSFNADTRKITVLDQTSGSGTAYYNSGYETFGNPYIMKNELVYLKNWNQGTWFNGTPKSTTFNSVNPAGGFNKVVQTFSNGLYVAAELYKPDEIYMKSSGTGANSYYEYADGAFKNATDVSDNQFNSPYPTFLVSPSGKQTFWYEPRDGKNTLLVGDESGSNTKTIGDSADYVPYGWYGANDDFILLSKGGSELYIASPSKVIGSNGYQPLKVTDYHKAQTYPGYGYGYGGQ